MRIMGAAEDPANPIRKLVGTDQLLGLDHFSFAMDPFGLYCVQPWTLLRQQTGNDAHALPAAFDLSVVRSDPAAHLFTRVPTGVIPDHKQRLLAHRGELLATVLKKLGGDGTHRPAVHEPHPRPLPDLPVGFFSTHQHPVSGQSLRVGVAFDRFFLDETHRLPTIGPGMQTTWSLKATPPCLILEAQSPLRAAEGEPDQPISSPFFLSYSGSGELIHLLVLSQRTPNLLSVERIVSPETRSLVVVSRLCCQAGEHHRGEAEGQDARRVRDKLVPGRSDNRMTWVSAGTLSSNSHRSSGRASGCSRRDQRLSVARSCSAYCSASGAGRRPLSSSRAR